MKTAYKFKLRVSKEQGDLLDSWFRSTRFVWNTYVKVFKSYHPIDNHRPVYPTTTELRAAHEFLLPVSAAALQQKARDFEEFRRQFFSRSRKSKIQHPRFKHQGDRCSFRLPNQKFKVTGNKIKLEKLPELTFVQDREFPTDARMLSVTVSKSPAGNYFASILFETQTTEDFAKTNLAVGLDVGLKTLATLSSGKEYKAQRYFKRAQRRLAKLQQHQSRKVKGSNRYKKSKGKIAKCQERVANQRKWTNHQISHEVTKDFDLIAVETLNIKGLVKNRRLSKAIHDAGWRQLLDFIKYKAERRGKSYIEVDRFYPSSRLCRFCGTVNTELTLSDRNWICQCGAQHHRDVAASINIVLEGLRTFFRLSSYQPLTDAERKSAECVVFDLSKLPFASSYETSNAVS